MSLLERVQWAVAGALALALYYRLRARVDAAQLFRELADPMGGE